MTFLTTLNVKVCIPLLLAVNSTTVEIYSKWKKKNIHNVKTDLIGFRYEHLKMKLHYKSILLVFPPER